MATVTFTIKDGNTVVGSGTLTIPETQLQTVQVSAISGTINGVSIDGLSTFDNADNQLNPRPLFGDRGNTVYSYGVDGSGLAFTAGGVSYNIMSTPNSNNNFGISAQSGDNLASSSGADRTLTFETSTREGSICFVSDTLILTPRGDTPVQLLRVGDLVVTAAGSLAPISWLGHRVIDHPVFADQPIRIAVNAFGGGRPARDLWLSSGHPVLVGADADNEGGVLVPIMCLINGTTIERVTVDAVTYWHVELDSHDILLAEGLPAESYIDLGSRPWFTGVDGALYDPDMALPDMPGRCRPVAIDGPVVEAERRRLDMVFAARLACAADWPGAAATLFL